MSDYEFDSDTKLFLKMMFVAVFILLPIASFRDGYSDYCVRKFTYSDYAHIDNFGRGGFGIRLHYSYNYKNSSYNNWAYVSKAYDSCLNYNTSSQKPCIGDSIIIVFDSLNPGNSRIVEFFDVNQKSNFNNLFEIYDRLKKKLL